MYDFSKELTTKEKEIDEVKNIVSGKLPNERLAPVPQSEGSKNTKLCFACTSCEYRKICWPEVRTFKYSYGKEYLVDVVKKPRVEELID
jgi:MoaA/NifB/PqqE/SkfB family radical SAM enzyme